MNLYTHPIFALRKLLIMSTFLAVFGCSFVIVCFLFNNAVSCLLVRFWLSLVRFYNHTIK